MTDAIALRITKIRSTLPSTVRLIAVTKQVSITAMREAYDAGVRDFGESKIQETEEKQAQLKDLSDITWHLIGHLQSNKVKKALEIFDWIHSVDSLSLAQRLNRIAGEIGKSPQACLQVKLVSDPNKYGWTVPELLADLPALNQCSSLQIKGLMTILPQGLSESEMLDVFTKTRQLSQDIQPQVSFSLQELSMGMSADYPLAVQAGATMIRVGRTIFGERA